jgi:TolB protein
MNRRFGLALSALVAAAVLTGCSSAPADGENAYVPELDSLRFEGEVHLRNIRQLTFGGNNAEAYFSFDDRRLLFQSDWDRINGQGCDQIFVVDVDGAPDQGDPYQLVSTGRGRTTCGYFLPDGRILYASTHAAAPECPPTPSAGGGRYVWPIYDTYDIYVTSADGSEVELLIGGEGYDAEATVSPDGRFIVFTSTRSGDLDLWRYDLRSGEVVQLTSEIGYDGGAFFSRDSRQIVWRASRPTGEDAAVYTELLRQNLIEPGELDVYVADIDGQNVRRVTQLPGANWAPFFHPDGKRVLFSSNHHTLQDGGRIFDIFIVNVDGTGLEQITHSGTFDAFPMFSFDGTRIAFSSNRNVRRAPSRDTNVFIAQWVEDPEEVDRRFSTRE